MNGLLPGQKNNSMGGYGYPRLLARKLFMESYAPVAKSKSPREEVEKDAGPPRIPDHHAAAHPTAIATLRSSKHPSPCPANGLGNGVPLELRDSGTPSLLIPDWSSGRIRTFFPIASLNAYASGWEGTDFVSNY